VKGVPWQITLSLCSSQITTLMVTGQQSNISTFARRSGKVVTRSTNNGILKKQDYLTMRNTFYFIKNLILF